MSHAERTEKFIEYLADRLNLADDEKPVQNHWSGIGTTIGSLTLRLGLISIDQLDDLLEVQEREGGLFGQVGVRLGYLTQEQVDALLEIQQWNRFLELGQQLVVTGRISAETLSACIMDFNCKYAAETV